MTKGLAGLVASINIFKGVTLEQIDEKLNKQDYLMPGAHELLKFFRDNGIISILASGSILPVVEHYQKVLDLESYKSLKIIKPSEFVKILKIS